MDELLDLFILRGDLGRLLAYFWVSWGVFSDRVESESFGDEGFDRRVVDEGSYQGDGDGSSNQK